MAQRVYNPSSSHYAPFGYGQYNGSLYHNVPKLPLENQNIAKGMNDLPNFDSNYKVASFNKLAESKSQNVPKLEASQYSAVKTRPKTEANTCKGIRNRRALNWLEIIKNTVSAKENRVRHCLINQKLDTESLQQSPAEYVGCTAYSSSAFAMYSEESTNNNYKPMEHIDEVIVFQRLIQNAIYGAVYLATAKTHAPRIDICDNRVRQKLAEYPKDYCTTPVINTSQVAVKLLSLSLFLSASSSLQEDFLSELIFEPYLSGHPNIVTPSRVYIDLNQQILLLIFPYAEFEDLFEVLKKRTHPLNENEVCWMAKQLLDAVYFLHRRGVAMRDLSLENVLMFKCEKTGHVIPKLTDPGQAVVADPEASKTHNTSSKVKGILLPPDKLFGKSFRPPEVYLKEPYDPYKVDSFCIGWMLYYCLTKSQLFRRAQATDQYWCLLVGGKSSRIRQLLIAKNGLNISNNCLDLIFQLLRENPSQRLSIYDALHHPFVANHQYTPVYSFNLLPNAAHPNETANKQQKAPSKVSEAPHGNNNTVESQKCKNGHVLNRVPFDNIHTQNVPQEYETLPKKCPTTSSIESIKELQEAEINKSAYRKTLPWCSENKGLVQYVQSTSINTIKQQTTQISQRQYPVVDSLPNIQACGALSEKESDMLKSLKRFNVLREHSKYGQANKTQAPNDNFSTLQYDINQKSESDIKESGNATRKHNHYILRNIYSGITGSLKSTNSSHVPSQCPSIDTLNNTSKNIIKGLVKNSSKTSNKLGNAISPTKSKDLHSSNSTVTTMASPSSAASPSSSLGSQTSSIGSQSSGLSSSLVRIQMPSRISKAFSHRGENLINHTKSGIIKGNNISNARS